MTHQWAVNSPPADVKALTAERDRLLKINVDLVAALAEIENMKPSEIAPETMPGFVHGPALLLANCQRIARAALAKARGE